MPFRPAREYGAYLDTYRAAQNDEGPAPGTRGGALVPTGFGALAAARKYQESTYSGNQRDAFASALSDARFRDPAAIETYRGKLFGSSLGQEYWVPPGGRPPEPGASPTIASKDAGPPQEQTA
jgi:hypothetical protein